MLHESESPTKELSTPNQKLTKAASAMLSQHQDRSSGKKECFRMPKVLIEVTLFVQVYLMLPLFKL